jgi:hypothetical protein
MQDSVDSMKSFLALEFFFSRFTQSFAPVLPDLFKISLRKNTLRTELHTEKWL